MRNHTSTYCNDTGHLIAILDGASSYHSALGHVAFLGKFYKGVRENDKCVVNVPQSCPWTKTDCQSKMNRCKELHKWSKLGRKELNFRMLFSVPTMVRLRKVSKWFKKQVNYVVGGEDIVLVEELVQGQRREFIDRHGEQRPNCPLALQEFLHYTYHRSDGQLVACGFHGVSDGNSIHLSEPTIHSVSGSFGTSDEGPSGISRVFQNHTCSDRCKNWKLPELEKTVPVSGWTSAQTQVMYMPFDQQNNNHPYTYQFILPAYYPVDDNQAHPIFQDHHSQLEHLNPHHAPQPQHVPPHTAYPQPPTHQGHHLPHFFELQWVNTSQLHPTAPPSYEL